jgi:AcrR family transcriptional regulator
LVDTAFKLFYQHGYHATGIDKILAESGVAKMTLYNHFKSKDELILAVLRRRDETFRNGFMRAVERRASDSAERLLTLFDVLGEWLKGADYSGCAFINAAAEYSDPGDPIHAASAEHKRLVLSYVRELAAAAGVEKSDELGDQLSLLIEGAIVTAQVTGDTDAAHKARRAAEVLVRQALAHD